jgi:hypothetical protein
MCVPVHESRHDAESTLEIDHLGLGKRRNAGAQFVRGSDEGQPSIEGGQSAIFDRADVPLSGPGSRGRSGARQQFACVEED